MEFDLNSLKSKQSMQSYARNKANPFCILTQDEHFKYNQKLTTK